MTSAKFWNPLGRALNKGFPAANYMQVGEPEKMTTVTTTTPRGFTQVQCMRCGMLWRREILTTTYGPARLEKKNIPEGKELRMDTMQLSWEGDNWEMIGNVTGEPIGTIEPETWRCCHRGEKS